MRRRLPPLNALLAFEAAARHNNFTRAAEELAVAQPAVTRHIANIENWIGAPLFKRHGSVVALTEEGQLLAELATAAFDRLELGIREIRRSRKDELVAGASFGVAHLWLMPRISGMRASSKTNINLVTSDDYRILDDPPVDFSVRFGNGSFGENRADLLFEENCQIIAAPSFLKANPQFDPDNLAGTVGPAQLLDHGDPNGIGWMDWKLWFALTDTRFPDQDLMTKVESYPTMLDMVRAGEGISIGTIGIEDDLIASGQLVCLGKPVARKGFGYYLVYREARLRDTGFVNLRAFLLGRE